MGVSSSRPIVPESIPVAYRCSSKTGLSALVDGARDLSRHEQFVLLLKSDNSLSGRILPSYLNAYVRYREGRLRSGSLQMEVLLFIAGTFKISRAIERCGALGSDRFVIVSSSKGLAEKYAKANNVRMEEPLSLGMDGSFLPVIE